MVTQAARLESFGGRVAHRGVLIKAVTASRFSDDGGPASVVKINRTDIDP